MCIGAHEQFDSIANGEAQVGELPTWMHIRGKSFWWIYQGSYDDMGDAWKTFGEKFMSANLKSTGPPGDLYICDPDDHRDDPQNILTLLWNPVE